MKYNWLLPVILVLMLAVFSLVGCSPGTNVPIEIEGLILSNQQEGIWVSGRGTVTANPNIAILRLGVEAQATSVAATQSQATEAMNDIMTV